MYWKLFSVKERLEVIGVDILPLLSWTTWKKLQ